MSVNLASGKKTSLKYSVRFINDEDGGELERFSSKKEAKRYIESIRATDGVSPDDTLRIIRLASEECVYEDEGQ